MVCSTSISYGAVFIAVFLSIPVTGQAPTAAATSSPRCTGHAYRQFDFWLGEWRVEPRAHPGHLVGTSVITSIHDGCVILETWTAPGQTGQSFNIYDRSRRRWHQTWVDNRGNLHEYWGEMRHGYTGTMVFEGDLPPTPGQTQRRKTRLTFFDLGPERVRQLSERLHADGTVAEVVFDFNYLRKP